MRPEWDVWPMFDAWKVKSCRSVPIRLLGKPFRMRLGIASMY